MSGYGDGNFGERPYGGEQPEEFDFDAFRKEIENWANGVSQEAHCAFASQCAARVLPNIVVVLRPKDFIGFSFDLILMRSTLTSAVAATVPTDDVKFAARSASSAARSAYPSAHSVARSAAASAYCAANCAGHSAKSAPESAYSALNSAYSARSANSPRSAAFSALSAAELLNQSAPKVLLEKPLWLNVTWPDAIANNWKTLRHEWSTDPAMAFWIDWYEGLLAGRTPDWDLWHDIVLIDDEHWNAGPEAVAREIELVKARLVAKRAPQAETIEIDEQTGKFKLEFSEPAKPDLLGATLDQIGDALDDAMANPSNGLHERSREVRVLQRALTKYANSPQRLEMDFTSVNGSLTRQIAKDELPPSEENLALLQATQEGAQGIRATHPDIAENRAILQNRAIAEMSKEDRDFVQDSVEVLKDLSQGILAEDFVEDAAEICEQEAEAENHRALGVYERNPAFIARDEKVRFFGRAAKILLELKKNPKVASIINKGNLIDVGMNLAMLNGLIDIALKVFGLF